MLHISPVYTSAPSDERIPLENKVYQLLELLNIPYERVDNDPVSSMDECTEISNFLGAEIRKSIFLCNRKKTLFYLVVIPANKSFNTKDFCDKLHCERLSFASADKMDEYLGLSPGSATVMGLINDTQNHVQLVIDKDVCGSEYFACNPGIHTSHIKFKTHDLLEKLLPFIQHKPIVIDLS